MDKKIVYKPNYISIELVEEIQSFFNNINDSLLASRGPYTFEKAELGRQGCWDRQLHWEIKDNPIHLVAEKLRADFGAFEIYESSIRYLSAPFLPHSDIRKDLSWIKNLKHSGHREGWIFIIPLSWKSGYQPGTAFYNNPARLDEPLYCEMTDILPKYAPEHEFESRNFSVREILKWNSPGDLVAWENFQWHSSCSFGEYTYTTDDWAKEFVSIETYFKTK